MASGIISVRYPHYKGSQEQWFLGRVKLCLIEEVYFSIWNYDMRGQLQAETETHFYNQQEGTNGVQPQAKDFKIKAWFLMLL